MLIKYRQLRRCLYEGERGNPEKGGCWLSEMTPDEKVLLQNQNMFK